LCAGAFDELVGIDQVVPGGAGDDLPLFDVSDKIGALFEIGGDLRGEKDAAFAVLDELLEEFEQVIAGDGVQSAGGFVEDQQAGVVGQGQGEGELDAHAVGELFDGLVGIEVKTFQVAVEGGSVPFGIKTAGDIGDDLQLLLGVIINAAKDQSDLLFAGKFVPGEVPALHGNRARIGVDEAQDGFNGGGLAGSVATDEAHDIALFEAEGYVLEVELGVAFVQVLNG